MRATIKVSNLPSAPKPTKARKVDIIYPKFVETLEQKQKELQVKRTIQRKDSKMTQNVSGTMIGVFRSWTDQESERLYRLRKAGMSIRDISKEMHRSKTTISAKIKELGYGSIKKRKTETESDKDVHE